MAVTASPTVCIGSSCFGLKLCSLRIPAPRVSERSIEKVRIVTLGILLARRFPSTRLSPGLT
jgi:hypothetical protein